MLFEQVLYILIWNSRYSYFSYFLPGKSITDQDIKQLLRILVKALESFNDIVLLEALVMCLTRLQPLLRPVSSFSHMQDLVINRETISNWMKNMRDNNHLLMRDLSYIIFIFWKFCVICKILIMILAVCLPACLILNC
jgi:hypothetical protein